VSETLFDKYGGFSTVGSIVHSFYEKVMDTDSLLHYFEGIDMERLIRHQTDFLCLLLGGPVNYSGRDLRQAHRRLNITEEDFNLVAELLEETLEECNVEYDDIEAIMRIIVSTKPDIIVSDSL
jgi:hemoglobin